MSFVFLGDNEGLQRAWIPCATLLGFVCFPVQYDWNHSSKISNVYW